MKQPNPEGGEVIDRRRKVQTTGQLRHEKMIVMKMGERRVFKESQAGHQLKMTANKSGPKSE